MSTPVQYPAAQYIVGGAPTVAGYQVISAVAGYQKDEEDKADANGGHRCKVQYSKRKTWSLELEVNSGTTIDTVLAGNEITIDATVYNITSVTATYTRGVQVLKVEAVAQVEGLT